MEKINLKTHRQRVHNSNFKQMNSLVHLTYIIILFIHLLFLTGCNSEDAIDVSPSLTLHIDKEASAIKEHTRTFTPIYSFNIHDKLSMFVVNKNTMDSYADQSGVINYPATYTGSSWEQAVKVNLIDTQGTVFAFYPYSEENTNPSAIHIMADETDYLFGQSSGDISQNNTNAIIKMRHIHSLIRFKFISSSSQSITEARITQMPESGTINLSTGHFTPGSRTFEKREAGLSIPIPSDNNYDYSAYILQGENIQFKFIINGKLFFYKPEIQFQSGYTYNINLTV